MMAIPPVSGEVSYDHNPSNSELNTDFSGRLAEIDNRLVNLSYQLTSDKVMLALASLASGQQMESEVEGQPFTVSIVSQAVELLQLKQDATLSFEPTALQAQMNDMASDVAAFDPEAITAAISSAIEGLAPVASTGAYGDLTGKPSLASVATSGSYSDLTGKPSLASVATSGAYADLTGKPAAISLSTPSRSLVSSTTSQGFQVSSTRDALVRYEGQLSTTSTIGGPASVSVFLETADTNSTTAADWTKVAEQSSSNTLTLALALQSVDGEPWKLSRVIPAGKWVRIRKQVNSGTGDATINSTQQEVLL